MLTIWLTLRSRLDQSYLERESVKMSSWTFFARMECRMKVIFFLLNGAMILNYVCFLQARRWLWIATSPSHDVLVLVRDLPIEKKEICYYSIY